MKKAFLGWLAVLFFSFFLGMFAFDGAGTTESVIYIPWLVTFFVGIAFFLVMIFKGKFK